MQTGAQRRQSISKCVDDILNGSCEYRRSQYRMCEDLVIRLSRTDEVAGEVQTDAALVDDAQLRLSDITTRSKEERRR